LGRVSSGWSPSLSKFGGSYPRGFQTCLFSVGVCSLQPKVSVLRHRELAFIRSSLLQLKLHYPGITSEDVRKSDLLAELTDVMSDGVAQDLWILSICVDNNPWDQYQPLIPCSFINICICLQDVNLSWIGPMYNQHAGFHYSKLLTYLPYDCGNFSNISGMGWGGSLPWVIWYR